jgi:hypothetical protein
VIIALDYDDTYTRDPELFRRFINLAIDRGHTVVCATSRLKNGLCEQDNPIDEWLRRRCELVFCCHNLKREMCEKAGYKVDIWIDDQPGSIEER